MTTKNGTLNTVSLNRSDDNAVESYVYVLSLELDGPSSRCFRKSTTDEKREAYRQFEARGTSCKVYLAATSCENISHWIKGHHSNHTYS